MNPALLEQLCEAFESASVTFKDVEKKKMFGCNAFFKNDAVFGLIWKTGRIGLKFDDETKFAALMNLKGSAPWKAGNKVMSKWVLVPEDFHSDKRQLSKWVKAAHSAIEGKAASAKKKRVSRSK